MTAADVQTDGLCCCWACLDGQIGDNITLWVNASTLLLSSQSYAVIAGQQVNLSVVDAASDSYVAELTLSTLESTIVDSSGAGEVLYSLWLVDVAGNTNSTVSNAASGIIFGESLVAAELVVRMIG